MTTTFGEPAAGLGGPVQEPAAGLLRVGADSAIDCEGQRDQALAQDAIGIPGISVRVDRRGDLRRLVLALPDLFVKKQSFIAAVR